MNFYKSAILTSNVINTWDGYLLWRQMRSYDQKEVPEQLKDFISSEEFVSSQRYGKASQRFSLLEHAKNMIISNAELLLQVPAKLYYLLSSKTGLRVGSLSHSWTFLVVSDLVATVMHLPFSYYRHFVIEKEHGFNKMTRSEFVKDFVKVLLLKAVLLYPIQSGLLHFIVSKFGKQFPLYLFGAGAIISFASAFIIPNYIAPLFNVYSPLDRKGELYQKIKTLADKINFPLSKVYVVDGSRRSNHSNAYFYGFWKNKRIVLYDTLLEQMKDDDEKLLAVLCHELGHWKYGHVYIVNGIMLSMLLGLSYGARGVIFNESLYQQFGFMEFDPVVGFMIYLEVFLEPIMTILQYSFSQLSRRHEFQADRFAVMMGYGTKLKSSMLTLSKENKSDLTPDPLYSALNYTHPPLVQRLDAISAEQKKHS